MTKKNYLLLFLSCICLALFLAACGNEEETDSGLSELTPVQGDLTSFSAQTMAGKEVTQDIFADYDLTAINIWTTTCRYCLVEMEGLEKLYEGLPDNVNFLTICADAGYNMELAESILKKKGATYETLIGNNSLNEGIMKNIAGTPTTIFVDSHGNLVGDAMVGAPCVEDMDRAASLYLKAIESHLKELE